MSARKAVHADVLAAEIGSTTTVVSAFAGVNTKSPAFLGQGQAVTTAAAGDVLTGLRNAVCDLETKLDATVGYDLMIAASSAAGGLKMTVHGLAPDMTARAAKEAALGAGAVVRLVTGGLLTQSHLDEIKQIQPNIILLAGGVDHGERETALHNAGRVRELGLSAPVVFGGNIDCRAEIQRVFQNSGQKLYIVDNVYPRIDELNVEGAQRAIQQVFEEHIVHAPGMSKVREMVSGGIMPTPGAVMEAAKALYDEICDLVVIDIGGATTDIHSVTEGSPENNNTSVAPEPLAKRTVEGDLGVFINSGNILDIAGDETACTKLGFDARETLTGYNGVPRNKKEVDLVSYMAVIAAQTAFARHAGRKRYIYGPTGRITVTEGKDLTMVRHVIGTGGVLTRLGDGGGILRDALAQGRVGTLMLPRVTEANPVFLTDNNYIMAVLGVLCRYDKPGAMTLLKQSLGLCQL